MKALRTSLLPLHVALLLLHTVCRASEPAESLCGADTCYSLQFGKRDFDAAQQFCEGKGGSLTTIVSQEKAAMVETLISSFEAKRPTPPSQGKKTPKTKLWMGLRRRRRQCVVPKKPLRGFYWVTGDDAGNYSNWAKEPVESCTAERCVALSYRSYAAHKSGAVDLKWEEGNCNLQTEFICMYTHAHTCAQLQLLGPGHAVYTTPFGATSSQLSLVPEGSTAEVYCDHPGLGGATTSRSVSACESHGWSTPRVSCPPPAEQPAGCGANNGGCDHICRPGSDSESGGRGHRCECIPGFRLAPDARTCVSPAAATDPCLSNPCSHECAAGGAGEAYTCLCPPGYELEPGTGSCVDVDECSRSPCEMLCANTPGSFHCSCVKWFEVDPINPGGCVYRDACSVSNCEHECEVGATGDAECRCHAGHELREDGESCADVDECELGACDQLCANAPAGRFTCNCTRGYVLGEDGTSCYLDTDTDDYEQILEEYGKIYKGISDVAVGRGPGSTPRSGLTTAGDGRSGGGSSSSSSSTAVTSRPRPGISDAEAADSAWLVVMSVAAVAIVLLVVCVSAAAACRRSRRRKQDQSKQSVDELWMAAPSPSPAQTPTESKAARVAAGAASGGRDSGDVRRAPGQADTQRDRGDSSLAEVNGNLNGGHAANALSDLLNEDSGAEVIVVD